MRLLECSPDRGFCLTKDLPTNEDLKYAILSHTWGPDNEEVTFKDLIDSTGEDKAGYEKIRFCEEQARKNKLRYFWVDTCCIDKSNQVELHEAINSMFRWYRKAARCYVYLSDVSVAGGGRKRERRQSEPPWEPEFRGSKWFTRGWTLQELLAPASVEFFTKERQRLGDKRSLERQIHEITGIAVRALRGTDLSEFSADERFKWAETRRTTREEDWAYCLLGIFGVFMTLIYGEGKEHAIRRLRKEIDSAHPAIMDPLSITAAVVSLIGAARRVINISNSLISRVQNAPKLVQDSLKEVRMVGQYLNQLQSYFENLASIDRNCATYVRLDHLSVVMTDITLTFYDLGKLLNHIKTLDTSVLRSAVVWSHYDKLVQDLLIKLQRHKTDLSLVINIIQGYSCNKLLSIRNFIS